MRPAIITILCLAIPIITRGVRLNWSKLPTRSLGGITCCAIVGLITSLSFASNVYAEDGDYWETYYSFRINCIRAAKVQHDSYALSCACYWAQSPEYIAACSADPVGYGFMGNTKNCSGEKIYIPGQGCVIDGYVASGDEPARPLECEGNPCDVISGRKIQTETDFQVGLLSFTRYYDSGSADPGSAVGARWRHNFEVRMDRLPLRDVNGGLSRPTLTISAPALRSSVYSSRLDACISGWGEIKAQYRGGSLAAATASMSGNVCILSLNGERVGVLSITSNQGWTGRAGVALGWGSVDSPVHTVTRANGNYYTFEETTPGIYQEASGYPVRLELDVDQWLFYDIDNTVDRFDDGKLLSRTFIDGRSLTLGYDGISGLLTTITDNDGNSFQLSYNPRGQIKKLTHAGGVINYGYGPLQGANLDNNLLSVIYEDSSVRQYHYEDTNFLNHLTGITDERDIRYTTWVYDAQGRAISSTHANGADLTTLTYSAAYTEVSDAAGGVRQYQLGNTGTRRVVTGITGDKCLNCSRSQMKDRTYDVNGYLDEVTDWNGNITDYDFDSRGLEAQRIEAKGTAQERLTTTLWHPSYRLPIKITEPTRVIDFTYDSKGQLLTRKVTP